MSDTASNVEHFVNNIEKAENQAAAAEVYARAIGYFSVSSELDKHVWAPINAAVMRRWPKGLQNVKRKAWKLLEASK